MGVATLAEPIGYLSGFLPTGNPLGGVTQDAASGIYCPASATEAAAFMAAAGLSEKTISSIQNCQEASGNLADAIDALVLVAAGSPAYAQTFSGWTRKSINITATTVQAFSAAAGVGPNPATESVAWFGWLATTATPGGNRTVLCPSNNTIGLQVLKTAANKLSLSCNGVAANSAQSYTLSTAYPLGVVYDVTHSTVTLYTHLEVLSGTFAAISDGPKGIGAVLGNGDSSSRYLYLFQLRGASAELSASDVRSLYQTAGWGAMPW